MDSELIIFASSKSRPGFETNRANNFQIQFPEYIDLENVWNNGEIRYEWVVAITELRIIFSNIDNYEIFILSDLCETSFYNSGKQPILQRVFLRHNKKKSTKELKISEINIVFENPLYMLTKQNKINSFHIFLKTKNGLPISFDSGNVDLTFHFKKQEYTNMEREFYIFISSDMSRRDFPFNKPDDFQNIISENIYLSSEWYLGEEYEWFCGITNLSMTFDNFFSNFNEILLLSDLCETSFFNGNKLPILQRCFLEQRLWKKSVNTFFLNTQYTKPLYVLLKQNKINQFRLYLRQNNGLPMKYSNGKLDATLHFIKKRKQ